MAWTRTSASSSCALVAELAEDVELRVLLGAFGDPGHAFPIIALGRALHARGHDVVRRDVDALAGRRRGARACASRRRRSTTCSRPRAAAEALRGGRRAATATRASSSPPSAPDVVVARHPHARPRAGRRARGRPVGDADPARRPARRRRLPAVLDRRAAAAHRRSAGRWWALSTRSSAAGSSWGATSSTRPAARLGLPPLDHVHGGISQTLSLVATFPQLEYPRADGPPPGHARRRAAAVGAADRRRRAAAGRRAARPRRAVDLPGPEHRLLRAALDGLADLPVRVLATYNRRGPTPGCRRPRQRPPRRLGVLRADDAALRRRRLPRRPRHAWCAR